MAPNMVDVRGYVYDPNEIIGYEDCEHCDGTGEEPFDNGLWDGICTVCHGRKTVPVYAPEERDDDEDTRS